MEYNVIKGVCETCTIVYDKKIEEANNTIKYLIEENIRLQGKLDFYKNILFENKIDSNESNQP